VTIIQQLRGTLADIAFSDDMTLKMARAIAKRLYEDLVKLESSTVNEEKETAI